MASPRTLGQDRASSRSTDKALPSAVELGDLRALGRKALVYFASVTASVLAGKGNSLNASKLLVGTNEAARSVWSKRCENSSSWPGLHHGSDRRGSSWLSCRAPIAAHSSIGESHWSFIAPPKKICHPTMDPHHSDYYPEDAFPLHIMPYLPETEWYYPISEHCQRAPRDKTFHAYTYRVLKSISNITINKHGLVLIDRYLHALQNKLCRCIAHMLKRCQARHSKSTPSFHGGARRVRGASSVWHTPGHEAYHRAVLQAQHTQQVHAYQKMRTCISAIAVQDTAQQPTPSHAVANQRLQQHCMNASIMQTFTKHILTEAIEVCTSSKKRRILVDHIKAAVEAPGLRVLCTQLAEDVVFSPTVYDQSEEE
ncbi:hypothetical protein GHT06_003805 [Daphnia sinensis]|uniref:Uncharacterized protein n=1 Tax=Daphnia sinensis TaxID=1820382 RepID=A0AAD5KDX0_9CRUS|nr:hypothetical protein GHT06_003805 [Daphnia sinensis]